MLTPRPIESYFTLLPKKLQQRYGQQQYYDRHQIRATIYHCDFNPAYLPLAYLLFLPAGDIANTLATEFPDITLADYKKQLERELNKRKLHQFAQQLSLSA